MQTEKEKMLAGTLYKARDPVLTKEREFAKEILFDFNNVRPAEIEKRNKLITKLLGKPILFVDPADALSYFLSDYTPLNKAAKDGVRGYDISLNECADCTIRGVNVKPPFWP